MPRSPFTVRTIPPSPYLPARLSLARASHISFCPPPFIYPLATLALRNPKRFSFSDYLSLSPVLPRFAARVFRAGIALAPRVISHYRGTSISMGFNRYIIDAPAGLSRMIRVPALCVHVSSSRRIDTSFCYFLMLKIMPFSMACPLFVFTPRNPHLSSLTYV